jgi:predicted extracellular nuclease
LNLAGARVLVAGDLNSYAAEPPITEFLLNGFHSVIPLDDPASFTFTFNAQVGTLDYNLYSTDYKEDVVAAAVYNVNTDEPSYYGYDTRFTGPQYFNGTDVFRYSDHDPIFLVLNIGSVDERPTATERSALSAVTRTVERQLGRVARALVRAP